jgi:DNA-binding PucR family transcriptional regulator
LPITIRSELAHAVVHRHNGGPVPEEPAERTAELIAEIAELIAADEEEIFEEMDRAVFATSPELAADATLAAETAASNRANMRRWLGAVRSHPGEPVGGEPPPEALEIASSLVRRGIDVSHLFAAYRAGQNVAWRRWMERAAVEVADRGELIAVLEQSSALMNAYVDLVLDAILAHTQRQREEVLGGESMRRAETIRLILDGAPLTRETATLRLGYELDRPQTALVIWTDERGLEAGELERAALILAKASGAAGKPLTLAAGSSALWAWLGGGEVDVEAIKRAMGEVDERLRVAIGPSRHGLAGFRRSHRGAIDAQRILAGAPNAAEGEPAVSWEEVQAVALAGQDPEAAREYVSSVLGALAMDDGPGIAELRETVRVYLEEGSSAPRAARRLHLHRNTVLYRLNNAEKLLGHAVGERRLALMLALELARFGR